MRDNEDDTNTSFITAGCSRLDSAGELRYSSQRHTEMKTSCNKKSLIASLPTTARETDTTEAAQEEKPNDVDRDGDFDTASFASSDRHPPAG